MVLTHDAGGLDYTVTGDKKSYGVIAYGCSYRARGFGMCNGIGDG
jgi:hypothetical protein